MRRSLTLALLVFAALPATAVLAQSADPLERGFREPPPAARPWVWWHWLNGNVTAEGAALDLEWMKRAGIGGVQVFEGDMMTPKLVDRRIVYMSPEWKRIFRATLGTAARLGIDVTVASSPGWSITGGPWVKPEAAMNKLVWSAQEVRGGRRLALALAQPSDVAGPYQDVALATIEPGGTSEVPRFYRDVATLAVRLPGDATPAPIGADNALLRDGAFGTSIAVPVAADRTASLVQDFGRMVTIRSVVVGLPGPRGFGAPPPPLARLEASDDGVAYRTVADLPASRSPVRSAGFAAVTARYFRLALQVPAGGGLPPIPGVAMPSMGGGAATTTPVAEFALGADARIGQVEEKAGYAAVPDYYRIAADPVPAAAAVVRRDVLDVSRFVDAQGILHWTAPAGRWRILRMGYSLTGHHNGPAPVEATGLEVDKLSAAHVRAYADEYLGMYADALGTSDLPAAGLKALLSDSIESGPQNWTEAMATKFRRLRGYDLTPWLPALTGIVIGDTRATERFLWDFRATIADLLVDNHYGVLADAAKARGLDYYSEALEDHRPQLGDDLAMRRFASVPMGAMWVIPPGGAPNPTYVADLKGAASVAHLHGRPIVGAESLTAFGQPFAFSPRDLKSTVDLEFALGVTRPIIHTSAHQPFVEGHKPGMALATILGQYFTRNETWAEQARAWTDYLARSSFLLRQGRPQADIVYFAGEEAPITALYGDRPLPDLPPGHGFDFVGRDALFNRLRVKDGRLVTPNGVRYEVLVLGGSSARMTLKTLARIAALVDAGATVVGTRPTGSPSLADDDRAFARLAMRLWGDTKHIHRTVAAALAARGIAPDWDAGLDTARLAVLHRRLDDGELYFISNRAGQRLDTHVRFRVAGRQPELWRADTARIAPLGWTAEAGRTVVPLALEADDAVFVMFRKPATGTGTGTGTTVAAAAPALARTLTGSWQVHWSGAGQPVAPIAAGSLGDWSKSADFAIRHFSGTATYAQSIEVPPAWLDGGQAVLLDLGDVRELAEVRVNGVSAGTLWHPPFRVDIAPLLHAGTNRIEIAVVNLWVNRLIGDAQPGAAPVTFTQAPTYTADASLRPSGLIGPVTLWRRGGR